MCVWSLRRREDEGENDEVEEAPGEHDGDVDEEHKVVDRGGDLKVPQDAPKLLRKEKNELWILFMSNTPWLACLVAGTRAQKVPK